MLTGHRRHPDVGKGNASAAANSFQAREGATGVIGHNLVDSLIYKQSLMKFLVFINNALQPRAPVCRHRYSGIPFSLTLPLLSSRSLTLSSSSSTTPFIPYHFPTHTPVPALPRVPSSDTLYRPGFQPTLALSTIGTSSMNHRVNMLHIAAVTLCFDFLSDRINSNQRYTFSLFI